MNAEVEEAYKVIIEKAKASVKPMRVAVAGADVENGLKGVFQAQEDGFVEPILIGNYKRITDMLKDLGLADRKYDIQPVADDTNVVQYAIEMIQHGSADCLMRGSSQTRDFLLPILNKANHLLRSPDALLTHVVFLKIPNYKKLLAISDVTLLVEPSIEMRKQVIKNMVRALKIFDVTEPNIALLSLVEKPSFHMKETVEAQTLVMHHREEPIANCNLVGPITYDLIVSKEAARLKKYDCPYCGEFDGIVVPSLMSGNLLVKSLTVTSGATGCGLLMGASIPISITGRSESSDMVYLSLAACAELFDAKVWTRKDV